MREGIPIVVIPDTEESYCPTVMMSVPHGMIVLE